MLAKNEAEYVAMSKTEKEISFRYFLLEALGILFRLPIIVRSDSIGANYSINSWQSSKIIKNE